MVSEWMLWSWMSVGLFAVALVDGVIAKLLVVVVAILPIVIFHLRERLMLRRGPKKFHEDDQ